MRQWIVFSLDRPNKPADLSEANIVKGLLSQSGINVRDALGVWEGQLERSFIAEVTSKGEAALVKSIALNYEQDAVLSVNLDNFEASLEYFFKTPRRVVLGHWVKSKGMNREGMTLDLSTMQVYVVK